MFSDENKSRFSYLLPYDVSTVQRSSQNSVVIAFDLLILKNYIFRVYQAHIWWMEADVSCHEKNVLEFVHLAIRTDVGTNNGVNTLDVKVVLDFRELDFVIFVVNDKVCDNFFSWNLYANSDRWLFAKILTVIGIQSFKFIQIRNKKANFDHIWYQLGLFKMLHNLKQLLLLTHPRWLSFRIYNSNRKGNLVLQE